MPLSVALARQIPRDKGNDRSRGPPQMPAASDVYPKAPSG